MAFSAYAQSKYPIPFLDAETGLYGYKHPSNGKVRIEPLYRSATQFTQAGFAKVRLNDREGIINKKGKYVIEPIYERVGWSENSSQLFSEELIGAKLNGKWGVLDQKGNQIISMRFDGISPFSKSVTVVYNVDDEARQNFGIIDGGGNYLIEPNYLYLKYEAGSGFYLAKKEVDGQVRWGIITKNDFEKLPFVYKNIDTVAVGLLKIKDIKNKWGIYNASLEQIYPHQLDSVGNSVTERFTVKANDHYTLMSKDGDLLEPFKYKSLQIEGIEPKGQVFNSWQLIYPDKSNPSTVYYDSVKNLSKNVFQGFVGEKSYLFNKSGEIVLTEADYDSVQIFSENFFIVQQFGLKGLVSAKGKMVLPIRFGNIKKAGDDKLLVYHAGGGQDVYNTQGKNLTVGKYARIILQKEGYFKVKAKTGTWGLLNEQLETLTLGWQNVGTFLPGPIRYNKLGEDQQANGVLAVKKDGFYGVIDLEENWVISPYIDSLHLVNTNYILFYDNGQRGTVNYSGVELYKTQDAETSLFSQGCTLLKKDSRSGLLNAYGTEILPPKYDSLSAPTKDSLVYVFNKGQKFYMDVRYQLIPEGNEFENIEYDPNHAEGFFRAKVQGLWGFLDYLARIRIYCQYDDVHYFSEGWAGFKLGGKWGFLNKQNRIEMQPMFKAINSFKNGKAVVKKEGKWGLIDKMAKPWIPFEYDEITETEFGNYIVVQEGKQGIYRQQDFLSIYPRFDSIRDLGNGTALVSKDGLFGISQLDGITIAYPEFKKVQYNTFDKSYFLLTTEAGSY